LPYLTALVRDGKLDAVDALGLNQLAEPVEYFNANSTHFAQAIRDKGGANKDVVIELIRQVENNDRRSPQIAPSNFCALLAEDILVPPA
jgi:hypothetical protein